MSELPIPRRSFLRGLGALVALPALDSLLPRLASASAPAGSIQNRLAFVYIPNGAHMQAWTPSAVGPLGPLPATLAPLDELRQDLLVLTGLTQNHARPNGDGPGDHARAAAAFLTGVQPFKTFGANIRAGVSVDQVAAARVGGATRLPSLELGCDGGPHAGNCDSGYSCAYSANISWKSESLPMAKEINPRLVFERLFADGNSAGASAGRARRAQQKMSILDLVLEDLRGLRRRLGQADERKLEQYLDGVREIEERIDRAEREALAGIKVPAAAASFSPPVGIPKEYAEHIDLMFDLMVLAFQTDSTRVATFLMANEGSNRSYASIGVSDGHHDLSHHGGNKEKQARIQKINRFHLERFARFIARLKAIPENDGTLLDHSMIVYGSGISDGNAHNHDELPVLLAGRGAGTLATGRHVRYPRNTPLNNLYLSLLDRMEASADKLGDSTGRLARLYGDSRSY